MAKRPRKAARTPATKARSHPFWPYGLVAFLLLLIADQYTKRAILSSYAVGESHQVLPFLSFTYVQNTGAIWSLFGGANGAFIWISIIVFGLLVFFFERFTTLMERISYVLIFVGLWGNLIDRVSYGFVVDFVDLGWWPVFNIADSCIVVAIILLLLEQLRDTRPPRTRPNR